LSPRVLITHPAPEALAREVETILGEPLRWSRLDAGAENAEVWLCATQPPASTLALPGLRWIHSGWAGVEIWRSRPEWGPEIALTRTVGDFPQRVAEHVFGYLLARELGVPEALRQMEARTWKRWTPGCIAGRTLLVVGYGAIGHAVGTVGRALGMGVEGIRRGPVGPLERASGIRDGAELDECLARAEFVVNLLPLTPATESFWDARRLGRMREGSTFVNVSRGGTVDEQALLDGLERGTPARALLDVFRDEPLPAAHPFRGHPAVWVTPHVAGIGTMEPLAREFAEHWRAYRAGLPLRNRVDRARGY